MRHDVSVALGRAMIARDMTLEEGDRLLGQYRDAASVAELPDWIARLVPSG